MKRRGFTFVELLVVIVGITILASLSLPAISRAKLAGQTATCRNNLRQIVIGTQIYLGENHVYPTAPGGRWFEMQQLHVSITGCPIIRGSYAHNRWGSTRAWTFPHLGIGPNADGKARPEADVPFPASFIVVSDSANVLKPPNSQDPLAPVSDHGVGFNLLFADGHVNTVTPNRLANPSSDYKSLWNVDHLPHLENY